MFKFGLIKEAEKDFRALTTHYQGYKEPWVYYNLATCQIQLGHPEAENDTQSKRLKRRPTLLQPMAQ